LPKKAVFWLLLFAFLIGFSTTIAEPALIAIADKAEAISSGKIDAFFLRLTVAFSVGFAIALGVFRIVIGHPIHYYIITGYIIVVLITFFAPKEIIGLAYDSGGVTTSTVTVPLVAALGLGLAQNLEGRDPLIDGFGLIAFASLFPMITVMSYGIYAELKRKLSLKALKDELNVDNVGNSSIVFTFSLDHVVGINKEELHKFESEIKTIL